MNIEENKNENLEEENKVEDLGQEDKEPKAEESEVEATKPEAEQPVEEPVVEEAKEESDKPAENLEEKKDDGSVTDPVVSEDKGPNQEQDQAIEEPVAESKPAESDQDAEGQKRWYVIQALTGKEDHVKKSIDLTIRQHRLQDKVFQVLVPTEEIVEIKGGKRVEKVRKMFPGYVFLEMILDDETWYYISQTPGVARFIGTQVKPTPVSEKEIQRVLKQLGQEEKLEITFEKGEGVRVISGPFRGYTGTVDEINSEKGKLKVLINIFGRDTPVEVNFEHAQKIV